MVRTCYKTHNAHKKSTALELYTVAKTLHRMEDSSTAYILEVVTSDKRCLYQQL